MKIGLIPSHRFRDILGGTQEISMDLEARVRFIMQRHNGALTVDQVADELIAEFKPQIRSILNSLVKNGALDSVRGGGPYSTHYKADAAVDRRGL